MALKGFGEAAAAIDLFYRESNRATAAAAQAFGIHIRPNGEQILMTDRFENRLYSASVSEAWDLDTIGAFSNTTTGVAPDSLGGLFVRPNGARCWIIDRGTGELYEFDLTTDWDISTLSFNDGFNVQDDIPNETAVRGVVLTDGGSRMYIAGEELHQFDLSNNWDASSRNFTGKSINGIGPYTGVDDRGNGTDFIAAGNNNVRILSLSTAWDIETASLVRTLTVNEVNGVSVGDSFSRVFVADEDDDVLEQYERVSRL